jgi:hypothetical protein
MPVGCQSGSRDGSLPGTPSAAAGLFSHTRQREGIRLPAFNKKAEILGRSSGSRLSGSGLPNSLHGAANQWLSQEPASTPVTAARPRWNQSRGKHARHLTTLPFSALHGRHPPRHQGQHEITGISPAASSQFTASSQRITGFVFKCIFYRYLHHMFPSKTSRKLVSPLRLEFMDPV